MGIRQEVERWRESQGKRSQPGWWGFALLAAELCVGVARACSHYFQQRPRQSSGAEQHQGKPPRLIQELEILSEGGQEILHPGLLAALPGRHLAMAKRGTSSPQVSCLLSWGTGTGKVQPCGLSQSLLMEVQCKSWCASSSPPVLHISWVIVTVWF